MRERPRRLGHFPGIVEHRNAYCLHGSRPFRLGGQGRIMQCSIDRPAVAGSSTGGSMAAIEVTES